MKKFGKYYLFLMITAIGLKGQEQVAAWIGVNQLGYLPSGVKVAVWAGKSAAITNTFQLVDAKNGAVVFTSATGKAFGSYGPFNQTARLNFTAFKKPGNYFIRCGDVRSPVFRSEKNIFRNSGCCLALYAPAT